MKARQKKFFLSLAFFLIMLGDLRAVQGGNGMIYMGLAILLFLTFIKFWADKRNIRNYIHIALKAFLLFVLMSIGICHQELPISVKIRLMLSYFIVVSLYMLSGYCFMGLKDFRNIGYGILLAYFIGGMVSLAVGNEIVASTSEGFPLALTGGFSHKNIVSFSLLAAFMGIYIYTWIDGYHKKDIIMLIVTTVLILLTNSRSAWLLYIAFWAIIYYGKIKIKLKTKGRLLLFGLVCIVSVVSIIVVKEVILKSADYMLRLNGLISYIDIYGKSKFHLWYGNGAVIYDKAGDFYSSGTWKLTGGKGTFEMGILNILAKMGLFGVLAYGIMLIRPLILLMYEKEIKKRIAILSVIVSLLLSAFTEVAIQNINGIYAVFCWCILSYLCKDINYIRKSR